MTNESAKLEIITAFPPSLHEGVKEILSKRTVFKLDQCVVDGDDDEVMLNVLRCQLTY